MYSRFFQRYIYIIYLDTQCTLTALFYTRKKDTWESIPAGSVVGFNTSHLHTAHMRQVIRAWISVARHNGTRKLWGHTTLSLVGPFHPLLCYTVLRRLVSAFTGIFIDTLQPNGIMQDYQRPSEMGGVFSFLFFFFPFCPLYLPSWFASLTSTSVVKRSRRARSWDRIYPFSPRTPGI